MPRTRKSKRAPGEYASSVSVEFISVTRQENGRTAKKSTVEKSNYVPPKLDPPKLDPLKANPKIKFDAYPTLPASLDTGILPPLDMDPPQAIGNESAQQEESVSRAASALLFEWIPHRPEYLNEHLRLEAPQSATHLCGGCQGPAVYRCLDCFSSEMMCQSCIVSSHAHLPLHIIQKWNGYFFEDTTLTALGLVLQLGHYVNKTCPNPSSLQDLMVFDLSRVHRLVVRYCGCGGFGDNVPKHIQLFRVRWFPATIVRPSTAFTFNLLDFFHKLQNQNKCNPYDFYHTIIARTDAAGLDPVIHRYDKFTLAFRIWSHLQILKRAGSNRRSSSDDPTSDGSVAIACPACPQPGRNTTHFPEPELWKNTLFLGIDACFKLKLKERGFDDPDLGTGLAYLVNNVPYEEHLKSNVATSETVSTCGPDLHAVNEAYTKNSQGYAVTGVAAVSCRHAFVRPNGVADLQRGERYLNIDYALASTLAKDIDAGIKDVVVTYDIACQWSKNLFTRLATYDHVPQLDLETLNSIRFAVPKFHLTGHSLSCQTTFNLALMDGVGMTHGEGVETIWSHSTSLATWSRENGPAARHLILDDHWNEWNWPKLVGLRSQLMNMLEKAQKWAKTQRRVADSMTAMWSDFVPSWRGMLLVYKEDESKPNPFEEPDPNVTLAALKLQLAKEEAERQKASTAFPRHITPSVFLQKSLDIEAAQRRLKARDYDDDDGPMGNSFHEQRRTLSRNISSIRTSQQLHMTGIGHLLDAIDPLVLADRPETVPLWLPSDLPLSTRDEWCITGLPRLEYRLRCAVAANALEEVRRSRRFYQVASAKIQSHISNTNKTGTRAHGQLDKIKRRMTRAVDTYQACWSAIKRLAPNEEFGTWKNTLRELRREDIRGPGLEKNETSNSRHIPSWIWQTSHQGSSSSNDQDLYASLRVEWCKAQERAARYEEEVELVVEEMRRTLTFFDWLACQWEGKATAPSMSGSKMDSITATGISAYAHKQAAMYRKMINVFVDDWYQYLDTNSLGSSWLSHYCGPPATKQRRLPSNVHLCRSASTQSSQHHLTDSDFSSETEEREIEAEDETITANINHLEELMNA